MGGDTRGESALQTTARTDTLILGMNEGMLMRKCSIEMKVTKEQMHDAQIDLAFRDHCAHLLIPLNECRRDTMYLPWKCEHERHGYEKCQYLE